MKKKSKQFPSLALSGLRFAPRVEPAAAAQHPSQPKPAARRAAVISAPPVVRAALCGLRFAPRVEPAAAAHQTFQPKAAPRAKAAAARAAAVIAAPPAGAAVTLAAPGEPAAASGGLGLAADGLEPVEPPVE